jgi:hypothetical protein
MLLPKPEVTERLIVVDEAGTTVGRVNLPRDPRLFGAEKGTVYLQRSIPSSDSSPGSSAHAA